MIHIKIWNTILLMYNEKQWWRLVLFASMLLIGSACGVLVFWLLVGFIMKNWETVLVVVGAPACLVMWWMQKKQQPKPESAPVAETPPAPPGAEELAQSYETIRRVLFVVLTEIADVLHLVSPTGYSQIDSPSRWIPRGNIVLFEYLILKKGDADTAAIKTAIQTRIRQMLEAQEISGITQSVFIYQGVSYPILYVDEVRDAGGHIQIAMVWANATYCEQLRHRAYLNQSLGTANTTLRDSDF